MSESAQLLPADVPDSVIEEIVKELSAISDQDVDIDCICVEHKTTVRKIIAAVQGRTLQGMKYIRADLDVQRRHLALLNKRPWWKLW